MESTQKRSRRGFVLGAAVAGAAAAAVASLPAVNRPAPAADPEPQPAAPSQGGGYRVSEHVQRYYKSARI